MLKIKKLYADNPEGQNETDETVAVVEIAIQRESVNICVTMRTVKQKYGIPSECDLLCPSRTFSFLLFFSFIFLVRFIYSYSWFLYGFGFTTVQSNFRCIRYLININS